MDANQVIQRIAELERAIEQSAAQHNALIGRLMELKDLLHKMAEPENLLDKAPDEPLAEKEFVVAEGQIVEACAQ